MVKARGIARLGLLAVGLGIAAAAASMPGIASADSSTDWLSSIDSLLGLSSPAADTTDNFAISFDGLNILEEGSASASSSGIGSFALADGADSTATATGTDDYALVFGDDSTAAGGVTSASSDDIALVNGDGSSAIAGGFGDNPGTEDYSLIFGNDDIATAGSNASSVGDSDFAYSEGNDLAPANAVGSDYMIDIAKTYETAAASTNLLTDATSGTADSSNLWTDLLSSLGEGTASSGGNLLTDLASLF
jgi:hypothetical protein